MQVSLTDSSSNRDTVWFSIIAESEFVDDELCRRMSIYSLVDFEIAVGILFKGPDNVGLTPRSVLCRFLSPTIFKSLILLATNLPPVSAFQGESQNRRRKWLSIRTTNLSSSPKIQTRRMSRYLEEQ